MTPLAPRLDQLRVALAHACLLAAVSLHGPLAEAQAVDASDRAAAESTELVETLRSAALPIALDGGRLSGPGAAWIAQASAEAQFVLVGEDHGMAESPLFAAALWNARMGGAFDRLVIETGPHAAAAMEEALRAHADGLAALNARFPVAIPYFGWREDGVLAATAVASGVTPMLCGVDQEFILSGRQLFRRLAAFALTPEAAAMATGLAKRDDALYAEMVDKQDPDAALLPRLQTRDFDALSRAFAGRADALSLIADLAASADIYRLQSSDPARSNALRSTLMKRNLMHCLDRMRERAGPGRALFRMGAFHAGRGRNPLGLFDLGNLASEWAQAGGRSSLHLLLIAAGGHANRWFPFAADADTRRTPYQAKEELGAVGALPLLQAADPRSWVLVPLAPLRTQGRLRRAGGEVFERLVFGYDAVIVVPEAKAAMDYTVD